MPIILTPTGTTPWASLYPFVNSHVPQCPILDVDDYLRVAAREFFRKSSCWRSRDVAILTTVVGQEEYAFAAPGGAELNRVHACYNEAGDEIDVAIPGDEDDVEPADTGSTWTIMVLEGGASLRMLPAPDVADDTLTGTVSWVPASNATGIPTWVYDDYRRHIAAGAAAELVLQAGRPWYAPASYGGLRSIFDHGAAEAGAFAGPVRRKQLRVRAV